MIQLYRSNEGERLDARSHPSSILHAVVDPDHSRPHLQLEMVQERTGVVSEGPRVERAVGFFAVDWLDERQDGA